MTHSVSAPAGLPVAVTCAADGRFAGALRALLGRVGASALPEGADVQPFVRTMGQVLDCALVRQPAAGAIDIVLSCERELLVGQVRWVRPAEARATTLDVGLAEPGIDVTCSVDGDEVTCRVSRRCL